MADATVATLPIATNRAASGALAGAEVVHNGTCPVSRVSNGRPKPPSPTDAQPRDTAARASCSKPSGSSVAVAPRLLNLRQAGAYLSLSYWSLRDYVLAGLIPVVELPPLRPREGERARTTLRRVLVDREDLDRFIESRKRGTAQDVQSRARKDEAANTRANRATVPGLCPAESDKCAR